ncbi:MAG: S-adenosyl-l-methionine hydroxide adenosyltransferase family protein [Candidatus Methylacidiphilales bacterium]|nr:SAM-dependent chlorinase/fluorinase [Candidatus Methylacidiphilales bacterium]
MYVPACPARVVISMRRLPHALLMLVCALVYSSVALHFTACSKAPATLTSSGTVNLRPIALLTDYGISDPYLPQLKGSILTINPNVNLVDLTHSVTPFQPREASFILNLAAQEFPANTIFVVVVDPGVGTSRLPILLKTEAGKYYFGPNNGIFTRLINREGFAKAWKLQNPKYFREQNVSATFHGRDIFGPCAAHLAAGVEPDQFGPSISRNAIVSLGTHPPAATGQSITAEVLHVDHYGNVITNIPRDFSPSLQEGVMLRILINNVMHTPIMVRTYDELTQGKMGVLYGSNNLLEICVNRGSAADLLKLKVGDTLVIRP